MLKFNSKGYSMRSILSYCEHLCTDLKRLVRTKDSGLLGSDTLSMSE